MSKSLLYAGNSVAQQTVATGTVISFSSIVRRYGCGTSISGGNAVITGGYYDIETNLSFVAGATGIVTVTVYKDGVAIPYATQSISVANGDNYAVSIPCIVRQKCDCESTITVVVSGVATTVNNAGILVIKE